MRTTAPRAAVAAVCFLLSARAIAAQQATTPVVVMSAGRLRAIGDSLAPGASKTAQLGKGAGYTFAMTHRDSTGGLEGHADWTDVFVVESGSATLLSGGVAEGARETTPGEWRGGSIRGETRAPLHPGDVVVIPAGTPHQMVLGPGERISYLALKVAAPH
jgi:mannose-6-phosphate isomerase-like protein (cupin superfamily)